MLVSLLPLFLDTYCLSLWSLGCKALCVIINLFILWSIWLSIFLVHFRSGSEYLTRWVDQVFIPLMIFLLQILVSISSRVLLRYFFRNFSFVSVWWCPFPTFPSTSNFSFSLSVLLLSEFSAFSFNSFSFANFLYLKGTIFSTKFHSYILYIIIIIIILCQNLHYMRWLLFSSDFVNL